MVLFIVIGSFTAAKVSLIDGLVKTKRARDMVPMY